MIHSMDTGRSENPEGEGGLEVIQGLLFEEDYFHSVPELLRTISSIIYVSNMLN